MLLSEEFFEQLRQSNDIVSAMSGYATLKKAGRDFICLCPFHSEKTPSCHIYTDDQRFYCFGCNAGGDIINFTRLTENLDFMGAVRLLAERAGISMPNDSGGQEELNKRSRIYSMNKEAARFFRDCLLSDGGRQGLDFLHSRGLTDNTIRKYGLGYAPDSWNALKYHMNSLGYHDTELVEAFLLKQNEKGNIYDIFRNRAMFPVFDRTGKIIAFSGRRIDDGKDYKYVNSSNTPVYQKGENIFSINFAKNSKKKYMIICEGNIDAVMLNQAGFDNAVAVLGTALTPSQARLLRFYCEEVVLAYDSDSAGEKATVKAINLLNKEGMTARVLNLGNANDPDDYIKQYGAESFRSLVEKSGSAISFEMDKLKSSVDLGTPEGRAEYLQKGVQFLSEVDNIYERTVYGSQLANDCGLAPNGINDAIEAAVKNKSRGRARNEKRELLKPAVKRDAVNPDTAQFPKEEAAERGIIAFLFHSPDKLGVILRNLSPNDFPTAFNRKLFETIILRLNKKLSIGTSSLGDEFSAVEVGRIEKIKVENAGLPFNDGRLMDYINVLIEHKENRNKKSHNEMNDEELREYMKKLKEEKTVKV
jgi:DNA primase